MRVTVIIPTYNEEGVVEACLESLSEQTYKDLEIIVVDDGSTDGTLSEIKGVKLFRQKHKGPGATRNLGAKESLGEILVFIDADMTFERNFIGKLIEPIINGKAKGTFSKEEYVSNWENIWARCWNINEGWEKKRRHPKNYPNEQKVFRAILKSEFDKVDGFTPGGYSDDWSLSEKLGYQAIAAKDAIFYHKNPDRLSEVFKQAKWVGKRPYKLGFIGNFIALVRSSLPVSLFVGLIKALINKKPHFIIFKVTYDLGIFAGILDYLFTKKGSK